MQPLHSSLANGRWFTLTLAEQLGNVGSEYERAVRWKQRADTHHFDQALARMLELLDLTIMDERWKNYRLKELTRLRESLCEELCDTISSPEGDLAKYFMDFAILARAERDATTERT